MGSDENNHPLKACLACGAGKSELITETLVLDRDQSSGRVDSTPKVRVYSKPDALIMKGRRTVGTKAIVCGECGYIHQFAVDVEMLKTGAEEAQKFQSEHSQPPPLPNQKEGTFEAGVHDWGCTTCGMGNYESLFRCWGCQTPRPPETPMVD